MKKLYAILMTLCLLCASCAALADMEIPSFDETPNVVLEDEETTIEEAAYAGEWVLDYAFFDREYVTESDLFEKFDFVFMPYVIADGKVCQDVQQENGEFVTTEMPYVFDAGQLQGQDAAGRDFVFELLENGNIVLNVFYPGEGEAMSSLSVFLKHPEE